LTAEPPAAGGRPSSARPTHFTAATTEFGLPSTLGQRIRGYGADLKQLFIGAEGTLGIITAAVLKLFPAPRSRATAWVALPEIQAAIDLLGMVRDVAGDRLTGFEIMSRQSVDFVLHGRTRHLR
jgi:FAD/FMN-containing dehydrogenase